jgi:hypothetical protein
VDLLPVIPGLFLWQGFGRRKQADEEQVRGEINPEDEKKESDGKVRGSRTVGAMEEGIFHGEIQVLDWGDEARGDQDGQEDGGL